MKKDKKKYLELKDLEWYQEEALTWWLCHGRDHPGKECDLFSKLDPKIQKIMREHTELVRTLFQSLEGDSQSEIDSAQKNLDKFVTDRKKSQGVGYIYFALNRGLVKIGCTSQRPIDRIETLFPSNHPEDGEVVLLHSISTNQRYKIEKEFHDYYVDKCVQGEWFNLSDEDIEIIKEIKKL